MIHVEFVTTGSGRGGGEASKVDRLRKNESTYLSFPDADLISRS